jgi:hypothetical protein
LLLRQIPLHGRHTASRLDFDCRRQLCLLRCRQVEVRLDLGKLTGLLKLNLLLLQ